MAELFHGVDASAWLQKGLRILTSAFKTQLHAMIQNMMESCAAKASVLWQNTHGAEVTTKLLGVMEKDIKSFKDQLEKVSTGLREAAGTIEKWLKPMIEKGRVIMDRVASFDLNAFVLGKLEAFERVVVSQLAEMLTVREADFTFLEGATVSKISLGLDFVTTCAGCVKHKFDEWKKALRTLHKGFEGKVWEAAKGVLSAAEDKGLDSNIKAMFEKLKSAVVFLDKQQNVYKALEDWVKVHVVALIVELSLGTNHVLATQFDSVCKTNQTSSKLS